MNDYKALRECTELFVNKTKSLSDSFKARTTSVAHKFRKNTTMGLVLLQKSVNH